MTRAAAIGLDPETLDKLDDVLPDPGGGPMAYARIQSVMIGTTMTRFVFLYSIGIVLAACSPGVSQQDDAPPQYPAANLDNDSYQPGPAWTLAWSDEFDGETLDPRKWKRQVEEAGRFNEEWQRYTDSVDNAYIDKGCLVIRAIHEGDKHGHDQYTSARLHTIPADGWKYGRIAARIQLPYGRRIWPAFWMLGANIDENGGDTPWPQTGEIDILEMYGSKDDGAIEANIHYADSSSEHASMGSVATSLREGRFADSFHVFELEWDADSLRWSVDGRQFASTSISGSEFTEFHKEFFILLNIAVDSEDAKRPDDITRFPQYMYVDWVRVYKRSDVQKRADAGSTLPVNR